MENQIENPQAFPSKILDYSESSIQQRTVYEGQNEGMTLRDYFAAKALNGIISNYDIWRAICMDRNNCTRDKQNDSIEDYVAQNCYQLADAMLKERSK